MEIGILDGLVISILVLHGGRFLNKRIALLERYNIPPAVTGGLVCSVIVAVIHAVWNVRVTFDMDLRNLLLLVFFATIGLTSRLKVLAAGGKALALMVVVAVAFLFLQNIVGVAAARLFGADPRVGLMAGTISFAGGHGTAISYGQLMQDAGLEGAGELGIACATIGLIIGGVLGGPIAGWLVSRDDLKAPSEDSQELEAAIAPEASMKVTDLSIINKLFLLALCIGIGAQVDYWLGLRGVLLPGFVTAMFVGIVLANLADRFHRPPDDDSIRLISDVSLQLYLAMSLMSMDLSSLSSALGFLSIVLVLQAILMTVFAIWVVYRVMGRDYDAAVITGGFIGLGLGATPVGIANMTALTNRYGPSPKAFLVIPLTGAFFIDIANATVIQIYLALPWLH